LPEVVPEKAAPRHSPAPNVRKIALAKWVQHNHNYHQRQRWLDRALKLEEAGKYTQGDVHLLNWILVGDCKTFTKKQEGQDRYKAVWESIMDPSALSRMEASPVYEYCSRALDDLGPWEPGVSTLVLPTDFHHSAM
jgi:hypothetical protein